MNLFDAPRGSVLIHACNCRGVWGSGVAREMKKRFLSAYHAYQSACLQAGNLGNAFLWDDNEYRIGCLMTSDGYGVDVDDPDHIVAATDASLWKLFPLLGHSTEVFSPKFNSGLFRVPWERTEEILKFHLTQNPKINWTICEL